MATSTFKGIEIAPDSLTWARERRGLDDETAARRLGISPDRLHELESGSVFPSPAQLRKASEVYRVSPAAFFLSEALRPQFDAPSDFRSLPDADLGDFSPELRYEIERVRAQIRILHQLAEEDLITPAKIEFTIDTSQSAEVTARQIRDWLGVDADVSQQLADLQSDSFLSFWIDAIEGKGIYVSQVSGVPVSEMRGFCIPDRSFPMIVLNGADAASARLFSLIHELAHLLAGQECVCSDAESNRQIETYCNAIAGAVLVPPGDAQREWSGLGQVIDSDHLIAALRSSARNYGISPEALMRRFHTLGFVSQASYRRVRDDLREQYEAQPPRSRGGGPPRDYLIVRNMGKAYVDAIVRARRRGRITDFEAAQFLFSKMRWLDPVERRLMRS